MNIAIISGSPRQNSNTLRVAKAISLLSPCGETDEKFLIDFAGYDLPFLNQGNLEPGKLSPFQESLVNAINRSQLIYILTPEYNWFPSAELVNMIHQLANKNFKYLFEDKVFALAGISSGRGGRMPAVQLSYVFNKLINVFSSHSIVSGKIFESQFTPKVLNEEGQSLGNNEYDKGLMDFIQYSSRIGEKWAK